MSALAPHVLAGYWWGILFFKKKERENREEPSAARHIDAGRGAPGVVAAADKRREANEQVHEVGLVLKGAQPEVIRAI